MEICRGEGEERRERQRVIRLCVSWLVVLMLMLLFAEPSCASPTQWRHTNTKPPQHADSHREAVSKRVDKAREKHKTSHKTVSHKRANPPPTHKSVSHKHPTLTHTPPAHTANTHPTLTHTPLTFTCEQIRELPLLSFLGGGLYKASYLTEYMGHSLVLRVASHQVEHLDTQNEFRSFRYKREVFRKEWEKIGNESCGDLQICIFGKCDEGDIVGDVVERIIFFEAIERVFQSHAKGEWWCWPLKWILDVLRLLAVTESRGIIIEPAYFESYPEFGISSVTGSLKQPDLDRFNVTPRKTWLEYCIHHVTNQFPNYEATCRFVDSWRLEECDTARHNADDCNDRGGRGYMLMSQRYIYMTFVRHLYRWAEDLVNQGSDRKFKESRGRVTNIMMGFAVLFEGKRFFHFPTANILSKLLSTLWKSEGERCIRSTFSSLMEAADLELKRHQTSSQRRMSVQQSFRRFVGKSLAERIQMYPYNEDGVDGRTL